MLHINLHTLYIYFIKSNLNLKEFQESNNSFKSYQVNKITYFVEFEFTFEFDYQTRFPSEFMIQYITTLNMCECKRILFYITPCHDGSHCDL